MQGTGTFAYNMKPKGITFNQDSAKDLMLKDSDYSTPTDHYFSHLQKLKSDADYSEEVREQ